MGKLFHYLIQTWRRHPRLSLAATLLVGVLLSNLAFSSSPGDDLSPKSPGPDRPRIAGELDRSPVDLVLTPDGRFLLSVNQTSGTLSLVDVAKAQVLQEVPCGDRPAAAALAADGKTVLVSSAWSGEVYRFHLEGAALKPAGRLHLGFEPRGVAFSPDGKLAYVALTTAHQVAVLDPSKLAVVDRIAVKRWPRYLALSPDGSRLAVGTSGDGGVSVVDTRKREMIFAEEFAGINLGHMQASKDGKYVYFPWMVYRHNPITSGNIKLGWVLASRIARVRLDAPARREAISLDPPGMAVSDPHGLALSPDEQWLVSAASGTHELLVYRLEGLPLRDYGGTDHIEPALLKDNKRFFRIPLGGRPMAVRYDGDGRKVYVANYLLNAVQVVGLEERKVLAVIPLGGAKEPSLARKGEAIFYDGQRSLDQWYSCHSCHYEGHTNSVSVDTRNDGRFGNFKTVLSLRGVTKTGPYFWHGWEKDLHAAVRRSMVDSMLGKDPTKQEVEAVLAFLDTLQPPANPYRIEGKLSEAALRGEKIFRGDTAGCFRCHGGPHFTDGKIHDVGTGSRTDVYKGYNPPTLIGIHDRPLYLHDGRAKTLEEVLRGPHRPGIVLGRGDLSEAELQDLLEYLKSL